MHLHPHTVAIGHHRHIAGNDGRDVGLAGSVHNLVHRLDVLTVDDGVHGEVGLNAVLLTGLRDFAEIVDGERIG